MHCIARWMVIALLAPWAGAAAAEVRETRTLPSRTAGEPAAADIDLADVPVEQALHLLAETFDVSLATGVLPETRVTVRLRGIGASAAFAAVAAAAGLEVVRDGAVIEVVPRRGESAVEAAAVGQARRHQVVDREFRLGTAPGEDTLKAIQPLLEPHVESATYNTALNLLTVSALPATLTRLEPLLADLTAEPVQFEIEVKVVEVSRNALRQMGSQGTFGLNVSGGVLATTFPLAGAGQSLRYLPSASTLASLAGLGGGSVVGGSAQGGSTGDSGFRFGQIDGRGIGLVIQALEQSGEARVMATPKVTALDNRKAHIGMVTTLRIPTYTLNQAFSTTSVTGIEQVDVGTTLDVRPRRLDGHQVLLTVTPEVSELEPQNSVYAQNGLTQGLPIVTRRRTDTEVILESGETLVIGGLVTEHKMETHGKTPGLGDLPLIGRAFRLEDRQSDSSELLVFVTPRELPSPAERRSKVRVDDTWVPNVLAARLAEARARLHAKVAADRVTGVRALEQMDAELRGAGVDVAPDVAALGADASGEAAAAAALFLLRQRPVEALALLTRFKDRRAAAVAALGAAPLAPHLRAALAQLLGREEGGAELLARRFDTAVALADEGGAARLGAALAVASPALAAARAPRLAGLGVWAAGGGGGAAPAAAAEEEEEEPLAWSGTPAEIAVAGGSAAAAGAVRAALDLLERRTPDLRNLVGFALAAISAGAAAPAVDAAQRTARVATEGRTVEEVAAELVELATRVFESRVRGAGAAPRPEPAAVEGRLR